MARAKRRSPKRRGRKRIATGDGKRRGRGGAATGTRVPAIQVVRDAEEVFRAAILAGVLSAERSDRHWAGHYLYMFHDEDGTAWFKHRDTRTYISMTARRRAAGVPAVSELRVVLCAALLAGGVAAAVAAAVLRLGAPEAASIASVRLGQMTAAWTTRAAAEGKTSEEVRDWGAALEAALDHVAERHGAVLLPARAVAAGAPDLTRQVEAALAQFLARRTGRSTGAAPGDGR